MPASFATIMYAFMGLPLLVILIFTLLGKKMGIKGAITVGYCTGLVQMAAAVLSLILLLQYNKASISFSQFWSMSGKSGETYASYFSADIFSLIVLFSIGLVIFSAFFSAKNMAKGLRFNFLNLTMVLLLGMNGIALVTDLFSLYVFLEATSIAAFVLIALRRDNPGLEGAFKYLVLSAIASAFILAGLGLIFMNTGSLRYEDIALIFATWGQLSNHALILAAFIMLIVGFSIKAGLVPFHGWLPDAYQGAPASVSIILGGIVTKMAGVYAIIRLLSDLIISQPVVNTCFMIFAMLSIFYGAVAAVGQTDFKRILAYSSISQIGYIVLGVACGSVIGYIGAVMHFFNHATFKTTLFVNSAAVEEQTGTTDITQLGGLQKQMPVTAITSIVAFFSTAGIPPLAGFWSKLLIVIAVWQAYGGIIAGLALTASLFTAAYFLKLQRNVFFGPAEEKLAEVKEADNGYKVTEIVLTVITVLMGLIFPAILLLLQSQGIL
jgi:proton-translocating NADH-quinone oxidoreductase chain N